MESRDSFASTQQAGRGTEERTPTRMVLFGEGNFILKTMVFRDITTALNERKHRKMVIRSHALLV